ncbi:MAG: DUF362 domain-containing protein [Candidatus Hodarchaeota archaeon]
MPTSEAKVMILKTSYRTLYEKLKKALQSYQLPDLDSDSTISIKINLCDARPPDSGAITHPLFLDKLLRILREEYEDKVIINVVESDASVAMPDLFIEWFGLMNVIKKWDAKYVNLSQDEIEYKQSNGDVLKEVPVPKTLAETDFFISAPKLKINSLTKVSCCLKNQFGCLPIVRKSRYHGVVDSVIAEINTVMRPDLCIVDGILSHVGIQGPAFGYPIRSNLVLVGNDPVALDAIAAKILGFNPKSITHILKCQEMKIGSMDYQITGDLKDICQIYKPNKMEWTMHRFASWLRKKVA